MHNYPNLLENWAKVHFFSLLILADVLGSTGTQIQFLSSIPSRWKIQWGTFLSGALTAMVFFQWLLLSSSGWKIKQIHWISRLLDFSVISRST